MSGLVGDVNFFALERKKALSWDNNMWLYGLAVVLELAYYNTRFVFFQQNDRNILFCVKILQ